MMKLHAYPQPCHVSWLPRPGIQKLLPGSHCHSFPDRSEPGAVTCPARLLSSVCCPGCSCCIQAVREELPSLTGVGKPGSCLYTRCSPQTTALALPAAVRSWADLGKQHGVTRNVRKIMYKLPCSSVDHACVLCGRCGTDTGKDGGRPGRPPSRLLAASPGRAGRSSHAASWPCQPSPAQRLAGAAPPAASAPCAAPGSAQTA